MNPLLGLSLIALILMSVHSVMYGQGMSVNFDNHVFGEDKLVYDPSGKPLVGTNWHAQIYRDSVSGLVVVGGAGTGLFPSPGSANPGTWSGGVRELAGFEPGQAVRLEIRVWDKSLFSTYDEAVAQGGVTGTSGLFEYTFPAGSSQSPGDNWLKNMTPIHLANSPAEPPLVERITYPQPREGDSLPVTPEVHGGKLPLRYLWQLPGGRQDTNRVLELGGAGLRPGIIDFNLTVTDADGRATPPSGFRIDVANRAPEVVQASAHGTVEGQAVAVSAAASYAWPPSSIRATWMLDDGRSVTGLNAVLPLLSPGRHTVKLRVGELGLVSLYDNLDSLGESTSYHVSSQEIGDEIHLSRTNQMIHEVAIYYYADLTAMTAVERARAGGRLRIYLNDGPKYPGLSSRVPGTVVYESPIFGLNTGYFLQRFPEVNVLAPDKLTWTVIWTNLAQTAGRNAGLVVGDVKSNPAPSNTGFSYNDYWVNEGTRWEFYHFANFKPVANFATRATAFDTHLIATSLEIPVQFEVTNLPPVFNSVASPSSLIAGQSGTFLASASDVSEGDLKYHWEFGDGAAADGPEVAHAYAAVGTFRGNVHVTDDNGGTAIREFSVSVGAEFRPLTFIGTPPVEAIQDRDYAATVAVHPPGVGQNIMLKPVTLPAWLAWTSVDDVSGRLRGRPSNADVGSHPVVVEATDGIVTERLAFTLVVVNVNDAPGISVPAALTIEARKGSDEIAVSLQDPDPGDLLGLTAVSGDPTKLPDDRILLSGAGRNRTLRILPIEGEGGTVPVTLVVSDGNLTARSIIQVTFVAPPMFEVRIASHEGGTVTLSPVADRYEQGFRVLATAAPLPGWQLRRWTGLPGGDVSATGLEFVWTVSADTIFGGEFADITAPLIQWKSPAAGLSENEIITLVGSITDNDRVVEAKLYRPGRDPDPLILTGGRYAVEGVRLDPGSNVFTIVAMDAAGNASTNRTVVIWQPGSVLLVGDAPDTREGQTVSFPVQFQSHRPLSGLSFNLHYRDYVEFLADARFEPSGFLPGALVTLNEDPPGTMRVTIATTGESIPAGTHTLGTLRMRVRSLLSPIGLQAFVDPELLEVSDELGNGVPGVAGIYGQTRLLPRKLTADLNGNNRLDIGDASLLQRLLVGLDPKRSWDTALNDLNKNGALDSGDVVRLMRVVVGQDAQPIGRTAGAIWPVARGARRAGDAFGWLEMDPSQLTVGRGQVVEVQVKIREAPPRLRGLRFTLAYPPGMMGLIGTDSFMGGPALPPGSNPSWHTEPSKGLLHFGLSSETNWPVATGVLAKFRFYVAETLPVSWQGEFGLIDAEFTDNGYALETLLVNPLPVLLKGDELLPEIRRLQINDGGGIQLNFTASIGSVVVLETTPDLGLGALGWRPISTRVHDGHPFFLAPDTSESRPLEQFYRLRAKIPALINAVPPSPGGH